MTVKPEFVIRELEKAAKDYERLNLEPMQREKVVQLASLCVRYLPIKEIAMRGFISRALREWQVENKTDFKDTLGWSKNQQINLTKEVMDIMKRTMVKSLVKPEQEPALDAAINAAFNFLKEAINNR